MPRKKSSPQINSHLIVFFFATLIVGGWYFSRPEHRKVFIFVHADPETATAGPINPPPQILYSYILGGSVGASIATSTFSNDVWKSVDAINWTLISPQTTSTSKWSSRRLAEAVNFKGNIWLMGGQDNGGYKNDIWTSPDGITWTHFDTNTSANGIQDAPWSGRVQFATAVFNNKLYVLGGVGTNLNNDVWSTANGTSWNLSYAPWAFRGGHSAVVFQNKLWVIGGDCTSFQPCNDVWSMDTLGNWTQHITPTTPTGGGGTEAVVLGGTLYYTTLPVSFSGNKIYSTKDGDNWMLHAPTPGFAPRGYFSFFTLKNTLWVEGGAKSTTGDPLTHDIWTFALSSFGWSSVGAAAWTPRYGHTTIVSP